MKHLARYFLISILLIVSGCRPGVEKTHNALISYADAHKNQLPPTWQDLAAWAESTGSVEFSAADAESLDKDYKIARQRPDENNHIVVRSSPGVDDAFTSLVNKSVWNSFSARTQRNR